MIERDPASGLALLVCATCGEELDDAQYSDDAECPKCHSELAEEGACISGFTWRERVAAAEKLFAAANSKACAP